MDEQTYNHKRRLLAMYQDNLNELEVQAARYGANPPLYLINEIKFHQQNIDDIRLQLRENSEEVTLDKLLVSIEELRQFEKEEAKRAFDAYTVIHKGDHEKVIVLLGLFSFGMIVIAKLEELYENYIKPREIGENGEVGEKQKDLISIAISIIGAIINFVIIIGLAIREERKQDAELIRKLGYDPLKPNQD